MLAVGDASEALLVVPGIWDEAPFAESVTELDAEAPEDGPPEPLAD